MRGKTVEVSCKDGIHRWHDDCKGDFIHGGGDRITYKADYYVNATWILKIGSIAKKALEAHRRGEK